MLTCSLQKKNNKDKKKSRKIDLNWKIVNYETYMYIHNTHKSCIYNVLFKFFVSCTWGNFKTKKLNVFFKCCIRLRVYLNKGTKQKCILN